MPNYRQVRLGYFGFIMVPLLAVFVWWLSGQETPGRGLVVLDVPADVTVVIDERPLKPCAHEYKAPKSCRPEPRPGFSRRYAYEAYRDTDLHIEAKRGAAVVAIDVHVDATAPAPHLRFDGQMMGWIDLGGVRVTNNVAEFVDKEGQVVGPVGPSEPD